MDFRHMTHVRLGDQEITSEQYARVIGPAIQRLQTKMDRDLKAAGRCDAETARELSALKTGKFRMLAGAGGYVVTRDS